MAFWPVLPRTDCDWHLSFADFGAGFSPNGVF